MIVINSEQRAAYDTDDVHAQTCNGLHDPAAPSCFEGVTWPEGGRIVERCDELSPFNSDEDAAKDAGLTGAWVECENAGGHFLVGCTPEEAGLEQVEGGQA